MEKSVVSIVKGKDVDEMLREAIDLIGGIESFVKPGDIVLVKPNAHGAHPPESHVDTNPIVVAAVVRRCKPLSGLGSGFMWWDCTPLVPLYINTIDKQPQQFYGRRLPRARSRRSPANTASYKEL